MQFEACDALNTRCLFEAVDRSNNFIALGFSYAPKNGDIALDAWVHNLDTKHPIPLAQARGSSHLRPNHSAPQPPARASTGSYLIPLENLRVEHDEPVRKCGVTKRIMRRATRTNSPL
jgi:hypothetical protein